MFPELFNASLPPQSGYVYVMRDGRGRCKIGHSVNPRKRRGSLSSAQNPVRIILLIPTSDMIALELELQHEHRAYRPYGWGEWFRLCNAQINAIAQRYGVQRR